MKNAGTRIFSSRRVPFYSVSFEEANKTNSMTMHREKNLRLKNGARLRVDLELLPFFCSKSWTRKIKFARSDWV
jgi:hypothetical protein